MNEWINEWSPIISSQTRVVFFAPEGKSATRKEIKLLELSNLFNHREHSFSYLALWSIYWVLGSTKTFPVRVIALNAF